MSKHKEWWVHTDCTTGSIEDDNFKMDCGNVFESDPQREDWDIVHVIEHSVYAEALALLRECREALTFFDNDHSHDILQKLDKFLGDV